MVSTARLNSFSCSLIVAILAGLWLVFASGPAWAVLRIDITKGGLQPLPIAVPHFVTLSTDGRVSTSAVMGIQVSDVITADLERSGLFRPLDRKAFLQDANTMWRSGPRYRDWRIIGADVVVTGGVRQDAGQVMVDFYLYDVFQGSLLGKGKRFTAVAQNWRHVAHRVADEIYTRLTGESGYFTSRIAFVSEKGKKKLLSMMDQDGANLVDLTRGKSLVLTPRFSPDGEHLFYISYETGQPRIFRWNIYTGKRVIQGNYPGLNSAPSFLRQQKRKRLSNKQIPPFAGFLQPLGTWRFGWARN